MALPKLNEVPQYELTIPSTGKIAAYRPFLVKEQKVLLIANESQDRRQVLRALLNTIDACVPDIDVNQLTGFDVDYIFTQIRTKSVGETSKVGMKCQSCEENNEVTVRLDEVYSSAPPENNIVKLTDQISVEMSYPKYYQVINSEKLLDEDTTLTEKALETLKMCLTAVITEEERILLKDESAQEIDNFIGSLSNTQLENLLQYVNKIPTLKYDVKFQCQSCGHDNDIQIEGINDFFS